MEITASHTLMKKLTGRKHLSKKFGGNVQQMVSPPDLRKLENYPAIKPFPKFVCLNPNMNPYAPQLPGALGLMFRSGEDDDTAFFEESSRSPDTTYAKTFVRFDSNLWLYIADCVFIRSTKLSTAEYGKLPKRVRHSMSSVSD